MIMKKYGFGLRDVVEEKKKKAKQSIKRDVNGRWMTFDIRITM